MAKKSALVSCKRGSLLLVIAMFFVLSACGKNNGVVDTVDEEESGTELTLDETYDAVRNGARLVLSYDAQSNSFTGYVENTTEDTLKKVRVEVHLSNGVELGPTKPANLKPGERMDIRLDAAEKDFVGWTAHPEVGIGKGNENANEHGNEGEGEHKQGGSN